MQAYAAKTEKMSSKTVLKEEQLGYEPESSGIINLASSGRSLDLPNTLRSRVRSQFGLNMDSLRVKESAQVADFGEKAMAQGNIISFAPGVFNPNTSSGRELIGHELHHITEQARGLGSNIEGSNIHYNPASESASNAAGRMFSSGTATAAMPSVMPVSADAAPVQGEGGFRNFFSKLFNPRRHQPSFVDLSDYGQNSGPQEDNEFQPEQQGSGQSTYNMFRDMVNRQETTSINQPKKQNPEPVTGEQNKVHDKPKPKSGAELKPDASPEEKTDHAIYETEKYFIPSPGSGFFKKTILDKSQNVGKLWNMMKSKQVGSIHNRADNKLFYGMTKEDVSNRNKDDDVNDLPFEDVIQEENIDLFEQYFGSEGKHAGLFKTKGNGISEKVNITYHANVDDEMYTKNKTKRTIMEKSYLLRPSLIKFVLKNLYYKKDKKTRDKLFNDKIKRSVILDVMKGRGDVRAEKYSRDYLKVMYEEVHKERKRNKGKEEPTNLDYNKNLTYNEPETERQKGIYAAMKLMEDSNCGHSWIETNSYDKDDNHRVRYTMGFQSTDGVGNDPFEKSEGVVLNPDPEDESVGSYHKTETVDKNKYHKALEYAKNFRAFYTTSGTGSGNANCTSFATGMAKAAGMNVKSSNLTLKGYVHSPDIAARDPGMEKTPVNQKDELHENYKDLDVPDIAKMNDIKSSELLMEACLKTEEYKSVFEGLSGELITAGTIVLKDKLLMEFHSAYPLKKKFINKALYDYSKDKNIPETLQMFISMVLTEIKPKLTSCDTLKQTFNEHRVTKIKDYRERVGKNIHRNIYAANSLISLFNKNKEELHKNLIEENLLDEIWKDEKYADISMRALLIALELHMSGLNGLSYYFSGQTRKPYHLVSAIKDSKDSMIAIKEFRNLFLKFVGEDDDAKKTSTAYTDIYFN